MPVHNTDIANIFSKVADLLEIQGANQFRVRAYRSAARTVSDLPQSLTDALEKGKDPSDLPGIGKDLAGKIREIAETGTLGLLRELEGDVPEKLSELMKVPGLGPKRVRTIHKELGVSDLEGLRKAAEEERIQGIEGFGKKTQQNILEAVRRVAPEESRIKLMEAEQRAEALIQYLRAGEGVQRVIIAGSYRRRKETVGDLDILAQCDPDSGIMKRFVDYEDVREVLSQGKTRSSVILRSGLQVDLRVLPEKSYGAALHYFTGSKAHNIAVRKIGVQRGLKINEYGVFKGDKQVAGATEEEVYDQVSLPFIPPELREDWGEIDAAREGRLPHLIEVPDIRGDLHTHTTSTDGRADLRQMAEAARERGYSYLAVTDHSKRVTMAHGLDEERLARQIEEVDRLNEKLQGITLLKGIELDILKEGDLDLPDTILRRLDLRVCSVHYNRNLSRDKMTERILRAMENPLFNILAHPTGRLINERPPYDLDMEKIMEAARDCGCILEINAHPDRLDLSDRYCKMAKEMGVKIAISTDAHSPSDLNFMRFGIDQARRGWLEADDVVNTLDLKELLNLFHRS